RDVDEDAAAVALAVDVAGAVEHLLEVRQRQLDGRAARRRVLAHGRVDRAGIAILDAGRRAAGAVRAVGRKARSARRAVGGRAVQFDLPSSAPSPSGRATGLDGAGSIASAPACDPATPARIPGLARRGPPGSGAVVEPAA